MVPVYMTAIMVVIVFAIAGHTAKQQMVHAPSVHFNKKRRETMPEVELPDSVASNGQKFISKSFLRKVAHLKDREDVISNPIEGNLIKRLVGSSYSYPTMSVTPYIMKSNGQAHV
ncbi:hypothetical protein AAC387_Pa08g2214 [Persea americana]